MDQCYTQFPEDTTTHTSTALSTRTSEDSSTTQDGTSVVMSTTDMPGSGNGYPLVETASTIFALMLIWTDHLNTCSTFCTVYSKFAWYILNEVSLTGITFINDCYFWIAAIVVQCRVEFGTGEYRVLQLATLGFYWRPTSSRTTDNQKTLTVENCSVITTRSV